MDKYVRGALFALFAAGGVPASHGEVLLTVDVSNPAAVVISGTGAAATANTSSIAGRGFSLLGFFTESVGASFFPSSNSLTLLDEDVPGGARKQATSYALSGESQLGWTRRDLICLADDFVRSVFTRTDTPAFEGAVTYDFLRYLSQLPAPGMTGDIVLGWPEEEKIIGRYTVMAAPVNASDGFVLTGALPVDRRLYPNFPVGMSQIRWVSDDGQVAGGLSTAMATEDASPGLGQAVVWTATGGMQALPNLSGLSPNLRGLQTVSYVSPDGTRIVGRALYNAGQANISQAAIWTRQPDNSWSATALGGIPGAAVIDTRPTVAASDLSVIYGFGRNAANRFVAFRWTEAGGIEVMPEPPNTRFAFPAAGGASADGTRVVGYVEMETAPGVFVNRPYIWDNTDGHGQLPLPEGMTDGSAEGISADGTTVYGSGYIWPNWQTTQELLRWRKDGMGNWAVERLGRPFESAGISNFMGVSGDGEMVVFTAGSWGAFSGWLRNSHGFVPLKAILESVSPAAAAYEISALGMTRNSRHIFGYARLPGKPVIGAILSVPPGYLAETRILRPSAGLPLTVSSTTSAAVVLREEETVETLEIVGPDSGEGTTTLAIDAGAALVVTGEAVIREGGALNILEDGSTIVTGGLTVEEAGTLLLNGELTSPETFLVGIISGTGTLNGNLTVEEGGTLSPGSSPGRLRINGSTTFSSGARLLMEIEGTTPVLEHDQLLLSGDIHLAGTLEIAWAPGYKPRHGSRFRLLNHAPGVRTGLFDAIDGLEVFADLTFDLVYEDDGVSLFVTRELASYDAWAAARNIPADQRRFDDTPLGDGLANLLRFAFDLPYAPVDQSLLPGINLSGGDLLSTFRVHRDVLLTPLQSSNLEDWSPVPVEWISVSVSGAEDGFIDYQLQIDPTDLPVFLRFEIGL